MPIARFVAGGLVKILPPLRRLSEDHTVLQQEKRALEETLAERNSRVTKLNYRVTNLKAKVTRLEAEIDRLKAEACQPVPHELPRSRSDAPEELSALRGLAVVLERERNQVAQELDRLTREKTPKQASEAAEGNSKDALI